MFINPDAVLYNFFGTVRYMVSTGQDGFLHNFFVAAQFAVSTLTGQDGPLWFIGVGWHSLWVVFPLPDWWTHMFLKQT
jgi:hypothetical protein